MVKGFTWTKAETMIGAQAAKKDHALKLERIARKRMKNLLQEEEIKRKGGSGSRRGRQCGYCVLTKFAKEAMYQNSLIRLRQIEQIIGRNDEDIIQLKENLKEDYFIRAKAAAYIIQNQPEVIGDLEEVRKVASLLQVDVTPNTAEGKLMQYIAVWREDGKGIVQIGMGPVRLLEATEKNGLSHIFTMVTVEKGITIFAADSETGGELDHHVVESLPEATNKLSLVFQNVSVQIAAYEYNPDMKRVLAISKIGEILMLSEEELAEALADRDIFCEKISRICASPFGQEKDVYELKAAARYVRINSYQDGHSTFGIIVDVTDEILEKLFQRPDMLGIAVFLMVDLDNLKDVNDHWGHEYGDRLLKRAAELLNLADQAMYYVKRGTKGCFKKYQQD